MFFAVHRWQLACDDDDDVLATRRGRPDIPLTKKYSVGFLNMLRGCCCFDLLLCTVKFFHSFAIAFKDLWFCFWALFTAWFDSLVLLLLRCDKSKFPFFVSDDDLLPFELNDSSDEVKPVQRSSRFSSEALVGNLNRFCAGISPKSFEYVISIVSNPSFVTFNPSEGW